MSNSATYETIRKELQQISVVDTHEHFCFPRSAARSHRDILTMVQNMYIVDDLRSVGFGAREWGEDIPAPQQWERVKGALARTANTTYFKVLQRIYRELFGAGNILELDYDAASAPSLEHAAQGAAWYDAVMDRANIQCSLVDKGQSTDFEYWLLYNGKGLPYSGGLTGDAPETSHYPRFLPILRIDFLAYCYMPRARKGLEDRLGARVETLDELEAFLRELLPTLRQRGFMGIKSCLGYYRDLHFLPRQRAEAEAAFRAGDSASPEQARAFQDYIIYLLAELAGQSGTVFEIHTGLRCFGSPYTTGNGPHELTELANRNPQTRFDFFHSGWPWTWQAAAMAKSLPNVYLSLNWLTAINETQAEHYLQESLDAVPFSKITWGGDCFYVEEAWAHLEIMRDLLARVLTERICSGHFDAELCRTMGRAILRDNAIRLYGLEKDC